ncbi:MAG: SDR family oxidoreductase [bacterium]|nr:SDR family oxidoreductase [bacterium]
MKILILGANGLIGGQLVRLCQEKNIPYVGTRYSRTHGDYVPFNLLEFDRIPRILDDVSPTLLINGTGLAGGVDFCQANPDIGKKYHVESNRIMVDWCRENNAAYAYVSTDYVFDGQNPPYKEKNKTNPLNVYGQYKLEGEKYIQDRLESYVIARTTNVFGWDPLTQTPNFLMHLMRTLTKTPAMKVPGFLYGNPTYAADLAAGILDLLENKAYGLYHIVGPGYISRFEWALKCVQLAGLEGKTLEKITEPPKGMVPRPLRSNLDTAKFIAASNIRMHGIEEGLRQFVEAMKNNPDGMTRN